jgi:hypothetical protein
MSKQKIGEVHARAMVDLGFVELRNASAFENSNVQDDIRRSMYDARQNMVPEQHQNQHQQPDLQQER